MVYDRRGGGRIGGTSDIGFRKGDVEKGRFVELEEIPKVVFEVFDIISGEFLKEVVVDGGSELRVRVFRSTV